MESSLWLIEQFQCFTQKLSGQYFVTNLWYEHCHSVNYYIVYSPTVRIITEITTNDDNSLRPSKDCCYYDNSMRPITWYWILVYFLSINFTFSSCICHLIQSLNVSIVSLCMHLLIVIIYMLDYKYEKWYIIINLMGCVFWSELEEYSAWIYIHNLKYDPDRIVLR